MKLTTGQASEVTPSHALSLTPWELSLWAETPQLPATPTSAFIIDSDKVSLSRQKDDPLGTPARSVRFHNDFCLELAKGSMRFQEIPWNLGNLGHLTWSETQWSLHGSPAPLGSSKPGIEKHPVEYLMSASWGSWSQGFWKNHRKSKPIKNHRKMQMWRKATSSWGEGSVVDDPAHVGNRHDPRVGWWPPTQPDSGGTSQL
jgi:hypothetical protein